MWCGIHFYLRPADSIGPFKNIEICPPKFENPISQLWDLIETLYFCEDLPMIPQK